ncbi:MAG TPA: hypothetical protein DHN33_11645 [Eubacteriaceae bacterium]|nr:hypothetical protein [Eubacteriaceae bacterium]
MKLREITAKLPYSTLFCGNEKGEETGIEFVSYLTEDTNEYQSNTLYIVKKEQFSKERIKERAINLVLVDGNTLTFKESLEKGQNILVISQIEIKEVFNRIANMLQICSEQEPLMNFCNRALLNLIAYDKEHNTQYAETLKAFVNKSKNPSELAKELNVHRNTLYYRLDKIKEIMDCSLDSMDVLFDLHLSFKILGYMK